MSGPTQRALDALRVAIDGLPAGRTDRDSHPLTPHDYGNGASAFLPATEVGNAEERIALRAQAEALGPWLQGPFVLADDLVLGANGRDRERWSELSEHVSSDLRGHRVLVVGCGAGYDAFAFAARAADYVLACEPSESFRQAEFLKAAYQSGVDVQRRGWDSLDSDLDGSFDIVHCNGLLHRVLDPMALLRRLRGLTRPGGTLLIGSMMLADPERSELLRFIPNRHAGDPTWWFVPGRLAFRWMVQTAGFEVAAEFGEAEGPRDGFPVVSGYLRGAATGGSAELVATG